MACLLREHQRFLHLIFLKDKMKKYLIYIFLSIFLSGQLFAQTEAELKRKYTAISDRLEFAQDILLSFPNPNARELLKEAEKLLKNARTLYDNQNYILANRQMDSANRLILNAIRLILTNPIQSQRKKLKELLLFAEKIVTDSGNRKAEQSLYKARDHDSKATAAIQKNQYQLALEHIRLGIFMANQVIEMAKNQDQTIREKVVEEEKRLGQLQQKAKDAVDTSKNPTALKLYQLAEKRIQKISQLIDKKNYSQAIDQYHQVTRLLLRVIDIANGSGQKSEITIYEDLARLDEMIENISDKISANDLQNNQRVTFLMDQLSAYQQNAHQALEDHQIDKARFHVQMGQRLLERALQIANRRNQLNGASRLSDELRQLDQLIQEVEKMVSDSGNDEAQYMLNLAHAARERADFLMQRQRNQLALAAIANSNRMAFAAERLVSEPDAFKPDSKRIERRLEKTGQQIDEISARQNLDLKSRLLFNEIKKVYEIALNSYKKGYLNVAEESLGILTNLLNKMPQ